MAIERFKSQIWSAVLLDALRKALVYGGPAIVNRDYEGDIAQSGDTVRITSISDPTVNDYSVDTDITVEQLTDAQRTLVVDQQKYFAFAVDDIDARQAAGNVMPEAMSRAAYKLADTADRFIAGLYTGAQSANTISSTSLGVSGADSTAYDLMVDLGTKLTEANVTAQGRYVVVPPWVYALLLKDTNFINAEKSGSTDALRNGNVGRAAGFDVYVSNNVPQPSAGSSWIVQAGVSSAITYAEQINKVVAYSPEKSFADAVKGLHLYGAKLIRPDSIAVATVTKA